MLCITWAKPLELLNSDINGAFEHVGKNFPSRTRRLARAVAGAPRLGVANALLVHAPALVEVGAVPTPPTNQ